MRRNRKIETKGDEPLAKWFNDKLNINTSQAIEYINSNYKGLLNEDCEKYNSAFLNIYRLQEHAFIFHRDNTSRRLHTNITRMNKSLRKYVTYDGHPLVSIDIVNSQPFLLSLLLQPDFYAHSESTSNDKISLQYMLSKRNSNSDGPVFKYWVSLSDFVSQMGFEEYWNRTQSGAIKTPNTSIVTQIKIKRIENMISILDASSFGNDISTYLDIVTKGTFYESFKNKILALGTYAGQAIDRDKTKIITCKVMFSNNRTIMPAKDVFSTIFPSVYDVIYFWKMIDHPLLAILLQAIESDIIIDRISQRIAQERPDLPLFTIHDSVVTINGAEQYVEAVMQQELLKAIGCSPELKKEYWEP